MKNLIVILVAICTLFQSCFSYRSYDYDTHHFRKGIKVKIKLDSSKIVYGKILKKNLDEVLVISKKTKHTIPKSRIKVIKRKKYSHFKTSILGTVILSLIMWLASKNLLGDFDFSYGK